MYWCWWYLVYAYTYKQNRTACQHSRPLKYITSWHFKCDPTLLMHTHKIQWIFTLRNALLWTSDLNTNKIQWIFTPRPALLWTSAILKCHVVISNISGRCRVITFESDIMMFRIVREGLHWVSWGLVQTLSSWPGTNVPSPWGLCCRAFLSLSNHPNQRSVQYRNMDLTC